MAEQKKKSYEDIFKELSSIDVRKDGGLCPLGRDGLTYIDKVYVQRKMQDLFGDDFSWRVITFDNDGFEVDENRIGPNIYQKVFNGGVVWTEVTVCGFARRQFLPIQGKMQSTSGEILYNEPLPLGLMTQDDWNRQIYRCFVKNVALNFGLGIDIYQNKSDKSEEENEDEVEEDVGESVEPDEGDAGGFEVEASEEIEELPTLAEAMDHIIVTECKLKGIPMKNLMKLKNQRTKDVVMRSLRVLAEKSPVDSAYVKVLLNALDDGTVTMTVLS